MKRLVSKGGRYKTSHLTEDQYEPGSRGRVLKNLLGITRKREINQIETIALQKATDTLMHQDIKKHCITEADIKRMHKLWLGDIYEWAGEYRTVNVCKGDFPFAAAAQIGKLMADFEQGSLKKHTPCTFKSPERIVEALAEVHTEFLLIHPFREGNGRLARLLSTLMALQADLPLLDFSGIKGKKKEEYFAAVRDGMNHDYAAMESFFIKVIRRSKRLYR